MSKRSAMRADALRQKVAGDRRHAVEARSATRR
jgi:hypothetical protein